MIALIKSLGGEGETYILYYNTNGRIWEIGLLLSNETCFHSQITFTYRLPVLSNGSNCKRIRTTYNSICVQQSLLITHTMTDIFLIISSLWISSISHCCPADFNCKCHYLLALGWYHSYSWMITFLLSQPYIYIYALDLCNNYTILM